MAGEKRASKFKKDKSDKVEKATGNAKMAEDEGPEQIHGLQWAVSNHIDSFNVLVESISSDMPSRIDPIEVEYPESAGLPNFRFWIKEMSLKPPSKIGRELKFLDSADNVVLPSMCRQGHFTYAGQLTLTIGCSSSPSHDLHQVDCGYIPVMVRSKSCHLHGLNPDQLVAKKEEPGERGGYFIINGNERVIRMLIQPRANYISAVIRGSFQKRGALYTNMATQMRCMRPDSTTLTNTLHYKRDGSCFLRFSHRKNEFLVPISVVAFAILPSMTDRTLFNWLCGASDDHFLSERAVVNIQQHQKQFAQESTWNACHYLGKHFRIKFPFLPKGWSSKKVGEYLVEKFFFVHTSVPWEKFICLMQMFHKLMGLVKGTLKPDNPDAFCCQEVLLPGQVYAMVLKEALEDFLMNAKYSLQKEFKKVEEEKNSEVEKTKPPPDFNQLTKPDRLRKHFKGGLIESKLKYFLSTGNIKSQTGLDLMQQAGYTIVADKLNAFRYLSHFRAVHRGTYFQEMKTTTVRKLLPETWGFLCPVHTPDGTPCGLLNHLAQSCKAVTVPLSKTTQDKVIAALVFLGVHCYAQDPRRDVMHVELKPVDKFAQVQLDGRPVGDIAFEELDAAAEELRLMKSRGEGGLPDDLEIVCINTFWTHMQPGLYLFTGPGRLIRPVRNLRTRTREFIGPMEQLFLNIAVLDKELEKWNLDPDNPPDENAIFEQLHLPYTHQEILPTQMLSLLASLTPFSNHNQSPRNMYQCQMLKQTMGTPYLNHPYRSDNKSYTLTSPQKPIVRTDTYAQYDFDSHPPGTNAIVAVITYTGYDMEDAMIINKASFERGFARGAVFKTKIVEAAPKSAVSGDQHKWKFKNADPKFYSKLDADGLPPRGTKVFEGDVISCSSYDGQHEKQIEKWKESEPAYVDQITWISGGEVVSDTLDKDHQRVSMKFRIERPPQVGDKFASRHGQKGVMSILWPQQDMPFTESGVVPDILFNPHGFPSRMTIGMLIESIAGKAAALEGKNSVNASSFRKYVGKFATDHNNEKDPFLQKPPPKGSKEWQETSVSEYFGSALIRNGYQYLGTEQMYSGIHGTPMETQIFIGNIYYQRLRHMVADKSQVRNIGPVDRITNQPIKGRKRHGGIRFGEMERDSLLAHGTSFLLHDRLMRCSDFGIGYVCPECGSIMTPQADPKKQELKTQKTAKGSLGSKNTDAWTCPPCSKKKGREVVCRMMPIPSVFRYLVCECASMGVNITLDLVNEAKAQPPSLPEVDVTKMQVDAVDEEK